MPFGTIKGLKLFLINYRVIRSSSIHLNTIAAIIRKAQYWATALLKSMLDNNLLFIKIRSMLGNNF